VNKEGTKKWRHIYSEGLHEGRVQKSRTKCPDEKARHARKATKKV